MSTARPDFLRAALDDNQIQMILAALAAVSPSGGGSPQYTLFRQLRDATGLDPAPTAVMRFQDIATRETLDAFA